MNPFFKPFDTPYQSIPFSSIKNEHYLPAFAEGIKQTEQAIATIIANTATPTFENTIVALENNSEMLDRVANTFFNLLGAHTSAELQEIAQKVMPQLTKLSNDEILNEALFAKVKYVYENEKLQGEDQQLLDETYKKFSRNGANLSAKDKETLRSIDEKLSKLSLDFGNNTLEEINKFELHITNEDELKGLPAGEKEAAAMTAKQKDKDGWVFTLAAPSVQAILKYADNRALRKKMYKASSTISAKGDDLDNKEIVKNIVKLRDERAKLLGFTHHADFVLAESMATSTQAVNQFLADLLEKAKPFADKEQDELLKFAKERDGIEKLETYDASYYSEKLKKELFDINDEVLKPYFKLENVIDGAFVVANKLYGLQFKAIDNVDTYHPDVKTYEVNDENGKLVALFYADFFPRASKRSGAWMNSLKSQGEGERPHIINVCNFTKPTETKPSLLSFREVQTLFHEFGHGLHGMLANTKYKSLSGTSVYRDFVELPSQVLENWCFEKECLDLFATHYQTGETIPMELIEKIKASANFREATGTIRQINFGMLDMAYHTINPNDINDVKAFEEKIGESTKLYPTNDYSCFSTAFGHIFAGGYSAGYYSYKWAEVLDADAFEYFKENGIFNRAIGEKFKEHILSKGGTQHPMELYKAFRGKEPNNEALLKRAGLLATA